jgi:hypothetical protein
MDSSLLRRRDFVALLARTMVPSKQLALLKRATGRS